MLVNVGYNNFVNSDRIIAVVNPESAPIKRLVQDAKDNNRAIDVTCGKKTKSIIITDSDHIILSAVKCEKISERISGSGQDKPEEPGELSENDSGVGDE